MDYAFEEHIDGSVPFNPNADRIVFSPSILPTDVAPGDESVDSIFTTFIEVLTGELAGHSITLTGDVAAPNLAASNWVFQSGGRWLIGDNTPGRVDDNLGHTLTGTGYADAFAGMGGNDSMVGNGGDDFFYQSNNAALGIDTLKGGAGIDSVIYDEAATAVAANLGTGVVTGGMVSGDSAQISGIENFFGGALNDTIVGSGLANQLVGNDGNDTVSGRAGDDTVIGNKGHDRLTGGDGADTFVFDAPAKSGNSDRIVDFTPGSDQLWLDNAYLCFTKLTDGPLAEAAFYAAAGAAAAHDASDRLIYDATSGNLWYDPDGTGVKATVLVATLLGAPALAYADITVI